jgi:type I restriction enzyme S subunit
MNMVSSGELWVDMVPADWSRSRIRNVAVISPGFSGYPPKLDELCTVVPMERMSEDGIVDFSNESEYRDVQPGLTLFEEGDVLFAKITPCMENGKGAFIDQLPTSYGFGSTEFHVLRPTDKVDGKFLYYYTFNPVFRTLATENMTGAAGQKRVPSRFLKDTRLFLPPLPEQERIAAFLDASCTAIDAAVAAKRRQLETLEAVQKSIIQRVVTRGNDESAKFRQTGNIWIERVPVGWDLVCLKRVSEIQAGLTLGKVYDGPLIEKPYLRVANVQDGHLDLEDVTTIEVPIEVAGRVELKAKDVLMTEGGDLDKLGRGTLWNGEINGCLHQNHIFAIRCFLHKLFPKFLTYLTSSQYGRDYFEATGKRTTNLASTNSTKVGAFPIPLPALSEQERLVDILDDHISQFSSLNQLLTDQIHILLSYRKYLIHECVTGQRRIPDIDVSRLCNRKVGGATII